MRLQEETCRRKNKRSSFDSVQLTWIPRKRHNTRWPINPPTANSELIAKLQPLIKFELHPSQIDEVAYFEQENAIEQRDVQQTESQQDSVPPSPRVPDPEEPAQQLRKEKPGRRRRTLRPSLSTISEATGETLAFPTLTPTLNRVIHASPAKRRQEAADQHKTPTKVTETPMKDFTLAATPHTGDIKLNTQSGHLIVPSSLTNVDSISGGSPTSDHAGQIHTSPIFNIQDITSEAPGDNVEGHDHSPSAASPDLVHTATEDSSTYFTALPFFDQPIPDVQVEPEHESRRRVSLNNARRSDRTSDVKIIKRVHNWMAGAAVGKKRRHSDMSVLHQPVVSKRRHTLDVDAGMNPDIFGQLKGIPPPAESPKKPTEMLHEQTEASHEHVSSPPTMSSENSTHDKALASPENDESEERAANESNAENEDDEENVEGDSDMAYLQSFVQRSKSSKEEKRDDVPSAPILLKVFSKKRRSGSLNSATSDAGSPMAKMTNSAATISTAKARVPLGEKDANKSPSPSKKRKLNAAEDGSMPLKKKSGRLVAPDLDDLEPATTKRKKRRKGIESDSDDVFNPEMDFNQVLTQRSTTGGAGARRSTRIATTQKPEPAPINVRLPGGVFVDNGDMPTVSTAGITNAVLQRKADQDLANKTRANTRKNRGGAVPVQMALASMAERTGDGDADEFTITTTVFVEPKVGRSGGIKTVRWDEILARVQGEETVAIAAAVEPEECKAVAESPTEAEDQKEDEEEDTQLPSPPQLRVVNLPSPGADRPDNPVANQLAIDGEEQEAPVKNRLAPVRRSSRAATVSRLPKRGGGSSAPTAAPLTPIPTPKRSSLPAPSRVSKLGGGRGGAAAVGAAETRARLGMAGPGTPAPRRGGRRGGRRC